MAVVPSGNEIKLQGTGDTDPVIDGSTQLLSTTFTIGSKAIDLFFATQRMINNTAYYYGYKMSGGNMYGAATVFGDQIANAIGDTQAGNFTLTTSTANNYKFGSGVSGNTMIGITHGTSGSLTNPNTRPLTYGLPFYSYLVPGQPLHNLGLGISLPNHNTMGSMSNLKFQSSNNKYWKVVQLFWFKNTDTNGTFYDETADINDGWMFGPEIFDGTNITNDNNSNWVFMLMAEQENSNYNSNKANQYNSQTNAYDQESLFGKIELNGLELKLRDAGYAANPNSDGTYTYKAFGWPITDSQFDSIGTSGTKSFKVFSRSYNSGYHNGIAEEFGGADSLNVGLGQFYRGGGIVDEDAEKQSGGSKGQANLPVSGEIKFSDFNETTKVTRKTLSLGSATTSVCFKSCSYTYYYGYSDGTVLAGPGSFGSLSSGYHAPTFDSKIIKDLYWTDSFGGSLTFKVQGSWPKDWFYSLLINNGSTNPTVDNYGYRYFSSSAAHSIYDLRIPAWGSTPLTYTSWTWGAYPANVSNPFGTTSNSTHKLLIQGYA